MTGFAAIAGQNGPISWVWEVRGVNGRGIDLRFRLPEGTEKLEKALRTTLSKACHRGTITAILRIDESHADGDLRLNETALKSAIVALAKASEVSAAAGVDLAQSRAADLLALRGVLEPVSSAGDQSLWADEALAQIPALVDAFMTMRADEGANLAKTIAGQVDEVAALIDAAAKSAEARKDGVRAKLESKVTALLQAGAEMDEGRLEQELALLAMKADVTEEIDRLDAHVKAARELLNTKGPIGRKFDFLMQEFNREANTLCSKSGSTELTKVGLSMKTLIEQMREQVQNIE